jgi:hypothetical protein
MKNLKPKAAILEHMKNYPVWYSGAFLEDCDWGGKKSATGRALRRLYSEGKLERKYEKLANRNDEQVFYRFKVEAPLIKYGYMQVDLPVKQMKLSV